MDRLELRLINAVAEEYTGERQRTPYDNGILNIQMPSKEQSRDLYRNYLNL